MSHIRINNAYYRTPEFIKFNKSIKSTVYFFLLSAVIRESSYTKSLSFTGGHFIYSKHYLKGALVSRYSQKRMAEYIGTSQPRISKYIGELEKDGLIKVIKRPTEKGMILYYQVGFWTGKIGEDSYQETLWFDTIFTKHYEAAKAKRDEVRKQHPDPEKRESFGERLEMQMKFCDDAFI